MRIEKNKILKPLTNRWFLGIALIVYCVTVGLYFIKVKKPAPVSAAAIHILVEKNQQKRIASHSTHHTKNTDIVYTIPKNNIKLSQVFEKEKISTATFDKIIHQPLFFNYYQPLSAHEQLDFDFNWEHQLRELIIPLGKNEKLIIHDNSRLTEEISDKNAFTKSYTAIGKIHRTLYGSMQALGISPALIMQFIHIFSQDINLNTQFHRGDNFAISYAATYKNHALVKTKLLGASLSLDKKDHYAILDGNDYYNSHGNNWAVSFLRVPVHYTYISSPFSLDRYHPILHIYRPHYGVDLAAPEGTLIHATSNGQVIYEGWETGYGNVIMIQDGIYTTRYAHMEAFEKNVHLHGYVKEGQVIGFVGMTGLATGPHVHYEFRINGKPVNPMTVQLPHANPIAKADLNDYESYVASVKRLLS